MNTATPPMLAGDVYHSKPELALQVLRAVLAEGFSVELVLADRLYGESGPFMEGLIQLELPCVVAVPDLIACIHGST